jgi:hypothetical protein
MGASDMRFYVFIPVMECPVQKCRGVVATHETTVGWRHLCMFCGYEWKDEMPREATT